MAFDVMIQRSVKNTDLKDEKQRTGFKVNKIVKLEMKIGFRNIETNENYDSFLQSYNQA